MNLSLTPLLADLVLAGGAGAVLVADLILPHGDKRILGWATLGVLLATFALTFGVDLTGPALGDAYVGGPMPVLLKRIFLAGGALAVLGAHTHVAEGYPRRQAEYYLMILASVLGMSLLAGARDLILLVVCFELMGIPLYVLAAYARTERAAVEGALKLFLIGAVSSVTILLGLSMLMGLAGSTSIAVVTQHAAAHPSPLLMLGGALALGGMGFKLGVFPFHMWVPDTYEGAGTPFVAFLAVAPKAATLAALAQLLLATDGALLATVWTPIVFLATATLIVGNLAALNQSNVKRLLAYSGVAHMGLLLMALVTGTELGLGMLLFYLMAYLFTNVGCFLVVHAVRRAGGDDSVASFDGLARRSSWLAMAMLLFLLSLAGIPFVAGFWAKIYVFFAAWAAGLQWLVVLGALLSVLALFYYLRVARAMYMNPNTSGDDGLVVDLPTNVAIAVCLALVVGMGLVPGPFVAAASVAAQGFLAGV